MNDLAATLFKVHVEQAFFDLLNFMTQDVFRSHCSVCLEILCFESFLIDVRLQFDNVEHLPL